MRIDLGVMLARDSLRQHSAGPLGGLALVLLCCTVYLPGFFSIPPVDRDESRFAQASRQMFESVALPEAERDSELHSGGLAVPMVGGKPRLNKPPLIYWLQAGSAAVLTRGEPLDDAIWMYRVPSLVAGFAIVLATWRVGCSMFDPRVGWVGACLLAVSPVFVWEAHQARADMVMVAWTVLAMGCLWRIWKQHRTSSSGPRSPSSLRRSVAPSLLLWVFVALGVLTKGPITPMVIVLTAAWLSVFSRDWRWLRATRPVLGVVIVVAAVAPWVWAVARQVGFGEYWSIVYDEIFARAGSAKEGHWGPPGYHLVLLVVLFWPGSLLTGLSIGRAWRRGFLSRSGRREEGRDGARLTEPWHTRVRRAPAYLAGLRATRRPEAFLIAWMLPSWIVFELVGTKLPHYTMPLYPAVALITARGTFAAMSASLPGVDGLVNRIGFWLWCVPGVLITSGLGAAAYSSLGGHWHDRPPAWLLWTLQLTSLGAVAFAIGALRHRSWLGAYACGLIISLCLSVGLLGAYLPRSSQVWFTSELVELAKYEAGKAVAASGFQEDSLVYLTRGRIQFLEPSDESDWWRANPQGVMIIPLDRVSRSHSLLGDVEGFRYTKGRVEQLAVVEHWWPTPAEPMQ